MLKSLVEKPLNSGFVNEAGEFSLSVVMDIGNKYVTIRNIPTTKSDDDEYPCLVVEETEANLKDYEQITFQKNIASISIISDKVSWRYNNNTWLVENDIAIKICMDEIYIFLVAYDSLAGFLKVIITTELFPSDQLEDYWSIKTETLDFLERKELTI